MNIDIVLFAGRIVLVALLYIFLFAVMKTGVGLVRGQRRDSAIWTIDVDKGPRGIRGIHVDMLGPVIVGRSPSSDICINEPFVSASHARFSLQGPALIIEDLNSLNGTLVNGRQLVEPATLREGDVPYCGPVRVGWHFDLNNLIDLFYRSFFVDSLDLIKMDLYGKSFFQQCLYDFLLCQTI